MPPRRTPAAAPLPATPPQIPNALFRSAPPCLNAALMIASVAGETIAPPKPWIARKMISMVPLVASAQASEPSVKIAIPTMKTRRRPNRSAALPPSSRKPPKASEYAVTIHCNVSCEIPRSV